MLGLQNDLIEFRGKVPPTLRSHPFQNDGRSVQILHCNRHEEEVCSALNGVPIFHILRILWEGDNPEIVIHIPESNGAVHGSVHKEHPPASERATFIHLNIHLREDV